MATAFRTDRDEADRIVSYLQDELDIRSLDLWDDLDALSTHTQIEQIEAPVEGVVLLGDGRFSAILNIYLILQYGNDDDEGFSTADSFLGKVSGRLRDDDPIVDSSSVDTSAFYEE